MARKITKREAARIARRQEDEAVAMFLRGQTLARIKRKTGVDGFIVRGLVMARAINRVR